MSAGAVSEMIGTYAHIFTLKTNTKESLTRVRVCVRVRVRVRECA
jgi:hypothetical protein